MVGMAALKAPPSTSGTPTSLALLSCVNQLKAKVITTEFH